jgi:hypothetical protein
MGTPVGIQMIRKGLLIPRDALGDLVAGELEAVRAGSEIVIRPKRPSPDERDRVRQVLRSAGLSYEPDRETPPPVPPEERACLAEKLGQAGPLSEAIIADRGDRCEGGDDGG